VIVATSFGNAASTTKTTGICRRSPGWQGLLREAEALELAEVLGGVGRAVARDRLAGERAVGRVGDLEDDLRERAGVDVDDGRQRVELPRQLVDVGVELDAHGARRVDLRVLHDVGLADVAQPVTSQIFS
jgi:hypothetical protein